MSRLNEIMENHEELEKLNALLKHYSVNAEFVTASLIEKLTSSEGEEGEEQEEGSTELVDDLKRLYSSY